MTTTPSALQTGQGEPNRVRVYSTDRTTTPAVPNELLSALRAVDDQLVIVRLLGREPYAFAAFRALNGLLVRAHVARPLGRIVRSALVAQLSRDLDRLAAEHEPRGLEKHFVLGGTYFAFDDLDGKFLLLAADKSRDSIPAARGAIMRVHAPHPIKSAGPTQVSPRGDGQYSPRASLFEWVGSTSPSGEPNATELRSPPAEYETSGVSELPDGHAELCKVGNQVRLAVDDRI